MQAGVHIPCLVVYKNSEVYFAVGRNRQVAIRIAAQVVIRVEIRVEFHIEVWVVVQVVVWTAIRVAVWSVVWVVVQVGFRVAVRVVIRSSFVLLYLSVANNGSAAVYPVVRMRSPVEALYHYSVHNSGCPRSGCYSLHHFGRPNNSPVRGRVKLRSYDAEH